MNSKLKDDNLVAHKLEGTSDKIYMACIRRNVSQQRWEVLGKWGRRGQTLKSQVKWTGNDRVHAERSQIDLFNSKLNEGYVNIDSPFYKGNVNRNASYIAESLELNDSKSAPELPDVKPAQKIPLESDRMIKDGDIVVCINNAGIEDKFDLGIDYVCEKHPDKQMIYVYDKNGVKGEFFTDRFKKS